MARVSKWQDKSVKHVNKGLRPNDHECAGSRQQRSFSLKARILSE